MGHKENHFPNISHWWIPKVRKICKSHSRFFSEKFHERKIEYFWEKKYWVEFAAFYFLHFSFHFVTSSEDINAWRRYACVGTHTVACSLCASGGGGQRFRLQRREIRSCLTEICAQVDDGFSRSQLLCWFSLWPFLVWIAFFLRRLLETVDKLQNKVGNVNEKMRNKRQNSTKYSTVNIFRSCRQKWLFYCFFLFSFQFCFLRVIFCFLLPFFFSHSHVHFFFKLNSLFLRFWLDFPLFVIRSSCSSFIFRFSFLFYLIPCHFLLSEFTFLLILVVNVIFSRWFQNLLFLVINIWPFF